MFETNLDLINEMLDLHTRTRVGGLNLIMWHLLRKRNLTKKSRIWPNPEKINHNNMGSRYHFQFLNSVGRMSEWENLG